MTTRWRKHRLAGLAVVAALAVSSCTFHPGSAAVVNGTSISQRTVDDLVGAACDYITLLGQKNSGASQPRPVSFFKHLFTQSYISFGITAKAARELRVSVSPAAIAKLTDQQPLPAGLSAGDREKLTAFFTGSARAQLQQEVIGAHLNDPAVTTADNVSQADLPAAKPYLATYERKQSVQVNPAYGSWNGQRLVDTDGSLSVPQSAVAGTWLRLRQSSSDTTGLPANQVCG